MWPGSMKGYIEAVMAAARLGEAEAAIDPPSSLHISPGHSHWATLLVTSLDLLLLTSPSWKYSFTKSVQHSNVKSRSNEAIYSCSKWCSFQTGDLFWSWPYLVRPVQFLDPASHRGQRVDNTDGLGLTMLISCNKIGNIPPLIGLVMTPTTLMGSDICNFSITARLALNIHSLWSLLESRNIYSGKKEITDWQRSEWDQIQGWVQPALYWGLYDVSGSDGTFPKFFVSHFGDIGWQERQSHSLQILNISILWIDRPNSHLKKRSTNTGYNTNCC